MTRQNEPQVPSHWLRAEKGLNPDSAASFVEYLRWMRSPQPEIDPPDELSKRSQMENNTTKQQILQIGAEKSKGYRKRLEEMTQRTRQIAGREENTFEIECDWRLRVGGHRGPESILLPAFDALGMPYIPSSTLRGIARNQAIRELTQQHFAEAVSVTNFSPLGREK